MLFTRFQGFKNKMRRDLSGKSVKARVDMNPKVRERKTS